MPDVEKEIELDVMLIPNYNKETDYTSETPLDTDKTTSVMDLDTKTSIDYSTEIDQNIDSYDFYLDVQSLEDLDVYSNTSFTDEDVELKEFNYNVPDFENKISVNYDTDYTSVNPKLETKNYSVMNLADLITQRTTRVADMLTFEKVLVSKSGVLYDYTSEAGNWTSNDFPLIPSNPSVGDGILLGSRSPRFLSSGVLVSTVGAGTYTIVWEYWDGEQWRSLSLSTNETNNWQTSGWVRIYFSTFPEFFYADSFTVSGNPTPDLFWIRARLSSFTSMTQQPKGQIAFRYEYPVKIKNSRFTQNEDVGVYRMTHYDTIVRTFKSNCDIRIVFKLVSYVDEATPRPYTIPKITISKKGQPFVKTSLTATEIGAGWYYVDVPAQYVRSPFIIRVLGAGTLQSDQTLDILPMGVRLGLRYLELQNFTWSQLEALTYFDIENYED